MKVNTGLDMVDGLKLFSISLLLYRPVRMHMDLSTNMKLLGLRLPYQAYYKVHSTTHYVYSVF